MARYKQRGLDQHHEQDQLQLIRDTRTLGQRIGDFFSDPFNTIVVLVSFAIAMVVLPAINDFILILGVCLFLYTHTRKLTLPFRMPQASGQPDYNDPLPGSLKPRKARGICYFGNDKRTSEELWFTNDDMRTHVLIFGSTGSGKTEALVSLAYNALLFGSGFIYVDGKGDNSLFAKMFSMTRSMGREDDILLINFMTGARDVFGPQEKRLSNTLNPFALGSSSMLSQLVVSMMDSASQTPDGDMWKGRAISFVEALMKMLVYMRDAGHILLDANIIRNYFHLERIEQIIIDKSFPRDNMESVSIEGIPSVVTEPLANFLLTLPGYDRNKKGKQGSQTLEQHGFITMQLTRVFTSLADTYGHILRVKRAEVDLRDVVLNRRILIVLLPALEKAPAELSSLGKIIISTLKAMMASGLGSDVEGSYRELIQRKPTNSDSPFMCILDEYGYYAVEGFAVVPAQARSLGFSAIFAGQDLPAFQKASKEEAASIGANTNIKIAMKLEDPIETWEFFSKTAGESYVTKVDTFQTRPESLMNNYMDTRSASAEKRARIDLLDLKEQREGEAHIFFKSKIIRARFFYAAPPPIREMRLNHQLRVDQPLSSRLAEFERRSEIFKQALITVEQMVEQVVQNEELQHIIEVFARDDNATLQEKADSIINAYIQENVPEIEEPELTEEFPDDELNIFTPYRAIDPDVERLVGKQITEFSQPILRRTDIRGKIELVEKISGRSSKQASAIADDLLRDMQTGTFYPPLALSQPDQQTFITLIKTTTTNIEKVIQKQIAGDNDNG